RVRALVGDGSAMYTCQALWTAAHERSRRCSSSSTTAPISSSVWLRKRGHLSELLLAKTLWKRSKSWGQILLAIVQSAVAAPKNDELRNKFYRSTTAGTWEKLN